MAAIVLFERGREVLVMPGSEPYKVRHGKGAGMLMTETSVFGHFCAPRGEWQERQRADASAEGAAAYSTSFTRVDTAADSRVSSRAFGAVARRELPAPRRGGQ
eukprot:1717690-Pyramimonas_sp.AAC.1